ncbi:putative O-glycosylation ligase, exosortase A system-associated [uncultured Sphingomonas sp.]|uniref:putative O-glycosylation ligase, exosortase A system-associated n=1 Tax=uncultured Sphingomonas sp. TaxID=158754 RepID=UPI0035CB618B
MRDLVFIAFLVALFGVGFRRPFLFVPAYVYIDIVSPQRLTYYLLNTVPISAIAFAFVFGGWLLSDAKRDARVAPRQILIVALLLYCWTTTTYADFPAEARDKWDWVWKALAFAAFLPLTLRTRLRIETLLLFMVLSAASIVIVGGIKTLASGGGYGQLNLMVDNNSGLYESSTIATVAVAVVPVILWFARHGTVFPPDWRMKGFAYALAFSCLLIPIGTSARTGLLCIGLLALLMLRDARRKLLYLGLIGSAGLLAVPFLPSAFSERMGTIGGYQSDTSASTRLAVWRWTIDYARDHPFGGGFNTYLQNKLRFETVAADPSGAVVELKQEVDQARAFHSAYFEMLGEQGYPGLLLWLAINVAGLFRMEVLRRRYRSTEPWAADLATALQGAHAIYLFGAAFVGIAFQPFVFMLVGTQIGLDTYLGRLRAEAGHRPMRPRNREAVPIIPSPA